jgi:hypothetical protein
MILLLDATVTWPLKSPNRTSGCAFPWDVVLEYSMTTSPPGRAACGFTLTILISLTFHTPKK